MKHYYAILFFLVCTLTQAQNQPEMMGGEYTLSHLNGECLTAVQREAVHAEIAANRTLLVAQGKLPSSGDMHRGTLQHPQFIWPVVAAPGSGYANSWSISNHVDHNPAFPSQLQDYACGQRTYDTSAGYNHAGVDIFTWPFSWYQMQFDQSHVVAAASGIIVGKSNGNFDKNCSFNNSNWNAVYVQHADGSIAWYGHMKNNSLTSKSVGDAVAAGEYLGVVGSSGNSTGPHLHFEVYNHLNQLIDPYAGLCNTWGPLNDSWWLQQKPYLDPKINAVLTHSAPPQFQPCPTTEITNLKDFFTPSEPVTMAIYLADQQAGTSGFAQIIRPDGSVRSEFVVSFADNYSASWWYWNYNAAFFDQLGMWKFIFTYNGQAVTRNFYRESLGTDENTAATVSVYPNPSNGLIQVVYSGSETPTDLSIYDMTGKRVHSATSQFDKVNINALSSGVYVLHLNVGDRIFKQKIIKQ